MDPIDAGDHHRAASACPALFVPAIGDLTDVIRRGVRLWPPWNPQPPCEEVQYERQIGIPRGRVSVAEPPFGMCTLRTGGAWYVPDFTRSSRRRRLPSRSRSYSSAVTPSTPTAPSLRVRRYASFNQSMSIR